MALISPIFVLAAAVVGMARRSWPQVGIILGGYGVGGIVGYATSTVAPDSHLRMVVQGFVLGEAGVYALVGAGFTGVATVWIVIAAAGSRSK